MKIKFVVPFLCIGALALGNLFSGSEAAKPVDKGLSQKPIQLLAEKTASNATEVAAAAVKKVCYCTCTALDGEPSQGQVFEHPGSGSSCSSYNNGGCNVHGENGRLSDCAAGPVPIGTTVLPPPTTP